MRPKMSLAGQSLLLQLCIVLLVVGVVGAVSLAESDATFRRVEGRRLLSVAENVAANDTVRLLLKDTGATDATAAIAATSQAVSGASYVQLTDRRATADRARRRQAGGAGTEPGAFGAGLGGRGRDGDKALVAHVPVLDGSGRVIGAVIAGWSTRRGRTAQPRPVRLISYLLIGGLLGVVGSLLLARRVKRQTLGLEPREITGLVEQREAMLHGIREGVIGTDTADRITLVNDEAVACSGLPPDARPVAARPAIAGEVGRRADRR